MTTRAHDRGIANPTAGVTVGVSGGTAYTASRKGEYFHHTLTLGNESDMKANSSVLFSALICFALVQGCRTLSDECGIRKFSNAHPDYELQPTSEYFLRKELFWEYQYQMSVIQNVMEKLSEQEVDVPELREFLERSTEFVHGSADKGRERIDQLMAKVPDGGKVCRYVVYGSEEVQELQAWTTLGDRPVIVEEGLMIIGNDGEIVERVVEFIRALEEDDFDWRILDAAEKVTE
ncbi:MAG TPA: hypothetical protein VMS21_13745 [Methylomirabilota bacterium]|nr:hypothetical protein [Methylomirabilota bacterium]